jgi:large subunit ribosomal protein L3
MSAPNAPRRGSLQYWPRKRARKVLPSPNWGAIKSDSHKKLKGFICYKAGMASAYVKDDTADSMTKGKKIVIPVTLIEVPSMKIFSVRFYKNGKVAKDVLAENLDKEIKKRVKIPKNPKKIEEFGGDFDDVRVLCYSVVKKTGMKKTPDLSEIGLEGSYEDKIKFIKENMGKEISVLNIFEKGNLVDFRGLTRGKGLQGPVRRFGITLKSHKSEKGRRKGPLGSFHPGRTTRRAPLAGQLGMFTRVSYNNKIIDMGKSENKFKGIKNFGDIKTDYLVVTGSVQGPAKRQLLVTSPLRATRKQIKKNFEVLEIR